MTRALSAAALFYLSAATGHAAVFEPWQDFPDAKFKETRLWREAVSGAYCYVTDHSRIDADGAPNAYHPADRTRKKPPFLGLDNPTNAGWPQTDWWPDVLVRDPMKPSRPYRQKAGPFKGYFVSQTALRTKKGAPTDPATYVDSRNVPYIVLPGSDFPLRKGTGAPGDVGMVWNLSNGKSTGFVIGDTGGGGKARLGEGSIALFVALGGANIDARNGTGVAAGKMRYVVFPGSRRELGWPADQAAISSMANSRLSQIGGVGVLSACVE